MENIGGITIRIFIFIAVAFLLRFGHKSMKKFDWFCLFCFFLCLFYSLNFYGAGFCVGAVTGTIISPFFSSLESYNAASPVIGFVTNWIAIIVSYLFAFIGFCRFVFVVFFKQQYRINLPSAKRSNVNAMGGEGDEHTKT